MIDSLYRDIPHDRWSGITQDLITAHPLRLDDILDLAIVSWNELWQTTIGRGSSAFPLADINPPAQVVGYLFEKLFLRNLMARFPDKWRGPSNRSEKDLVYVPNQDFSIELKTSGQLGLKVFGNRSYGQASTAGEAKGKSGYYITVNFYEKALNLVRFGWIDHSDWKAQASATGQMAGLGVEVYAHKLIPINGDYQLDAPLSILKGVGAAVLEQLKGMGISTIGDLLKYQGGNGRLLNLKNMAELFLGK